MAYIKNKTLTLKASTIPQPNLTINNYEWTINDIINPIKVDEIVINTSNLNIGNNIISLKAQNSCGAWSEKTTKIIEVINMDQTFEVIVDKPTTNVEVIMQLTGTVVVTVKDPLGVAIPNATVTIDTVTAITNASGIATLNGMTYGTKTGTVTMS